MRYQFTPEFHMRLIWRRLVLSLRSPTRTSYKTLDFVPQCQPCTLFGLASSHYPRDQVV